MRVPVGVFEFVSVVGERANGSPHLHNMVPGTVPDRNGDKKNNRCLCVCVCSFQCFVAVVVLSAASRMSSHSETDKDAFPELTFDPKIARQVLPLSIVFASMIGNLERFQPLRTSLMCTFVCMYVCVCAVLLA